MKTILVVEDSIRSQQLIKMALKDQYAISFAQNLSQAKSFLANRSPDLILLDINLNGEDGLSFYSSMTSSPIQSKIPVIFLTGTEGINYKISAFKLGATDFIVKPFEPIDLSLRVEARIKQSVVDSVCYISDTIYIDKKQQALYENRGESNIRVDLSPTEFRLICLFTENPETIYSRKDIFSNIWGDNINYLERTVDKHISAIRKKIPYLKSSIRSVYGSGYTYSPVKLKSVA